MRLKALLFMLLWATFATAQNTEVINHLIITEYRGNSPHDFYLELTNRGTEPVPLNHFKLGHWGGGHTLDYETGATGANSIGYWIPVDTLLAPGESFLIAGNSQQLVDEWEQFLPGSEKVLADNLREKADLLVLQSDPLGGPINQQWGGNGIYLRQMIFDESGAVVDSLVVDQVGGVFTNENGGHPDRANPDSHYPVAGVESALRTARLIRQADVTTGTLDFNSARGTGLDDSEWIAIPFEGGAWRLAPWTIKEDGHYTLDENTLESELIDVDFTNKTLTIPWGVVRGDDIMNYFVEKPNIVWAYEMAGEADSLAHAAQTGDKLHIHVVGNSMESAVFDIIVAEPAADANTVVSRISWPNPNGFWRDNISSGSWGWPRITKLESGNDTIWGVRGGIPYATRIDSLLVQLDKPDNADWEIVFESGEEKPDLAHGDKLLVTAEDGSQKEYFISVNPYFPSDDASLSTIHWPDIPPFYRNLFGWRGDTIPGFSPTINSYNVEVPLLYNGIPALVAKPTNTNATVEVERAVNLAGSTEDRTFTINVTAEDSIATEIYTVLLRKEQDIANLQPNFADPFISERVFNWHWSNNYFLELVNPGNQPLDLSDYMIAAGASTNAAEIVAIDNADDWLARYEKYIPGYKWTSSEGEWTVEPYVAERDLSVESLIYAGETFTLGWVNRPECDLYDWYPGYHVDVQFNNANPEAERDCERFVNHWGEEVSSSAISKWQAESIYLFKILNDSVKDGTKAATDPDDFELIDVFGSADGSVPQLNGANLGAPWTVIRKPHIYKGNPVPGAALGTTNEDSEYLYRNQPYFNNLGFGWPARMRNILNDVGIHFMNAPTYYMSTVASQVYKVSDGFESPQQIRGVKTGETVAQFLTNIIKADEGQTLTLHKADGTELADDDLLSMNDVLTVVSADGQNTTEYTLEVTDEGLSNDAGLTSTLHTVSVEVEPSVVEDVPVAGEGTITGFDYQTLLKTVVNGLTPAQGATMNVVGSNGGYVPLQVPNFDTTYVDVTVNTQMYVEVVAEDGVTKINYALEPEASESAAFVISYVYSVIQESFLIEFVPRGTSVNAFLSNVIPVEGATMKLIDKMGFERTTGGLADDDKLVVTSEDGTVQNVYHFAMLSSEAIPGVFYLAYILSDVYVIDQVDYVIDSVVVVDVPVFLGNVRPVAGATVVVVDENGAEKTSGIIEETDMVKVTSLDGKVEVLYSFGELTIDDTSTELVNIQNQIELFPNPTRGVLNVMGVEAGQRISVLSFTGSAVMDIDVRSNVQVIPLEDLDAGMYLIVIYAKDGSKMGVYKAVKQ